MPASRQLARATKAAVKRIMNMLADGTLANDDLRFVDVKMFLKFLKAAKALTDYSGLPKRDGTASRPRAKRDPTKPKVLSTYLLNKLALGGLKPHLRRKAAVLLDEAATVKLFRIIAAATAFTTLSENTPIVRTGPNTEPFFVPRSDALYQRELVAATKAMRSNFKVLMNKHRVAALTAAVQQPMLLDGDTAVNAPLRLAHFAANGSSVAFAACRFVAFCEPLLFFKDAARALWPDDISTVFVQVLMPRKSAPTHTDVDSFVFTHEVVVVWPARFLTAAAAVKTEAHADAAPPARRVATQHPDLARFQADLAATCAATANAQLAAARNADSALPAVKVEPM